MKTSFNLPGGQPLLSPLGRQTGYKQRLRAALDRLPPAAAPIAFTLAGSVAIIAVVASLMAGDPATETAAARPPSTVRTAPQTPAPAAPTIEEPQATTAADLPARAPATAETSVTAVLDAGPEPSTFDPALPDDRTSSIPPAMPGGAFVPVVEVAETADEVEALEAIQREQIAEDVGEPSPEETSSVAPPDVARVPATTTRYVNMRAGPDDNAQVLEVLPAQATVNAEANCDWCSVSYKGREGYVYKTFLTYE